MDTRTQQLLAGVVPSSGRGLELGPLDRPVVAKGEADITYVDHASQSAVRDKYRGDPHVDPARIVVDVALEGRPLAEALGAEARFDYILGSHVVEHVPDLVGWLHELRQVLAPGGQVRLAVPDRRFTFDFLRATSTISDVSCAYLAKAKVPQPHAVLDHFLHVTDLDLAAAWGGRIDPSRLTRPRHGQALAEARRAQQSGAYADVHVWVFTPRSFARLMVEIALLGLQPFACVSFADTARMSLEFFVGLAAHDDPAAIVASWQQMAAAAHEHDPEVDLDLARTAQRAAARLAQQRRAASATAPLGAPS